MKVKIKMKGDQAISVPNLSQWKIMDLPNIVPLPLLPACLKTGFYSQS